MINSLHVKKDGPSAFPRLQDLENPVIGGEDCSVEHWAPFFTLALFIQRAR